MLARLVAVADHFMTKAGGWAEVFAKEGCVVEGRGVTDLRIRHKDEEPSAPVLALEVHLLNIGGPIELNPSPDVVMVARLYRED